MIQLNDISENNIAFDELKIGDYFTEIEKDAIWKKINTLPSGADAVQITNNDDYVMFGHFNRNNPKVIKIEIISIDYKIK